MTTYPPSVQADARNRAWRTFAQALLVDVLVAVGAVLAVAATDIQWTREYWYGLAALVGKSVVVAAVSFFARKLVPPQP